jgi:hypothetical protein
VPKGWRVRGIPPGVDSEAAGWDGRCAIGPSLLTPRMWELCAMAAAGADHGDEAENWGTGSEERRELARQRL